MNVSSIAVEEWEGEGHCGYYGDGVYDYEKKESIDLNTERGVREKDRWNPVGWKGWNPGKMGDRKQHKIERSVGMSNTGKVGEIGGASPLYNVQVGEHDGNNGERFMRTRETKWKHLDVTIVVNGPVQGEMDGLRIA